MQSSIKQDDAAPVQQMAGRQAGNMRQVASLHGTSLWRESEEQIRAAHQVLHTYNTLQDNISLVIIVLVVHNARAVNEEDALHEGDVLPHLGLARHRRHLAHLHSLYPLNTHCSDLR